jgi:hypothetical protein
VNGGKTVEGLLPHLPLQQRVSEVEEELVILHHIELKDYVDVDLDEFRSSALSNT